MKKKYSELIRHPKILFFYCPILGLQNFIINNDFIPFKKNRYYKKQKF